MKAPDKEEMIIDANQSYGGDFWHEKDIFEYYCKNGEVRKQKYALMKRPDGFSIQICYSNGYIKPHRLEEGALDSFTVWFSVEKDQEAKALFKNRYRELIGEMETKRIHYQNCLDKL